MEYQFRNLRLFYKLTHTFTKIETKLVGDCVLEKSDKLTYSLLEHSVQATNRGLN